ncbi:hypothetical protein, partial [Bradyrhizobium brasilense]|uniref:hypothetical protein n=1 Tax=Bradyrhizobium brasilense TaxID=1419277 RepID=UPI001E3B217A
RGGALPKYRKQPHAKQPAAAGVRPGYLTRRATQGYFSNIPKSPRRTLAPGGHMAFARFCKRRFHVVMADSHMR